MVSGLTSDSYNYFFRNFGFSKVEAAEGVFLPEYSDFGMFFLEWFRSPLMMLCGPCF